MIKAATDALPVAQITPVPLAALKAAPQARTKSGLDARSLKELAESIQAHGLLQPIIVRVDETDGGYTIVAGHRRSRAMALAGFDHVPAIIMSGDANAGLAAQATENLQRSDLSLWETATLVRQLVDTLGSSKAAEAAVQKSKAWVSKHLALTSARFNDEVAALAESGDCEDIEQLHLLNQIAYRDPGISRILARVRAGTLGREQCRALLERLKAPAEAGEAEDGPGEADEAEGQTRTTYTLTLRPAEADKLDALGGVAWLRKQIKRAKLLDAD